MPFAILAAILKVKKKLCHTRGKFRIHHCQSLDYMEDLASETAISSEFTVEKPCARVCNCSKCLIECHTPDLRQLKTQETSIDMLWHNDVHSAAMDGDVNLNAPVHSLGDAVFLQYKDKYIHEHAKKRYSSSEHITRIFVLGNPGVGKSTFIVTLKREGSLQRVSESSVPPHTAGIVPSIHTSKHYGRVLFYDFAGAAEYYSSHAAILENLACTSKGDNIFIIVVDLREDSHKISCLLNYWVSFIHYQLFKERKPQLVILGSHLDLVKGKEVHDFEKSCENSDLKQSGCFVLDCRTPNSKEVDSVVQHITTLVQDSPRYKLSHKAAVLLGLLEKDFQHVTACPIQTIISRIKGTKIPLLTDEHSMCQVVFELHEFGLLFMISGENDVQLVLNMSRLTHDVHQLLFSEEACNSETQRKEWKCFSFPCWHYF